LGGRVKKEGKREEEGTGVGDGMQAWGIRATRYYILGAKHRGDVAF